MSSYPHRIAKFPEPYPGDLGWPVQTRIAAVKISMDSGASQEQAEADLVRWLKSEDYNEDFIKDALAFCRKQFKAN